MKESAFKESLLLYVASSIYLAVKNSITPITDDLKLKEKASKIS